jgi:hypothetical protein
MLTNKQLYDFAKSCLGKDIAKTQDELGCAESISYLLNKLKVNDFPKNGFLSTTDLYDWLCKSNTFTKVLDSKTGDIIISPTGYSVIKKSYHGHVGVCGNYGIMSNNSNNGLFQQTMDIIDWRRYYKDKLGFPVYYFRCSSDI